MPTDTITPADIRAMFEMNGNLHHAEHCLVQAETQRPRKGARAEFNRLTVALSAARRTVLGMTQEQVAALVGEYRNASEAERDDAGDIWMVCAGNGRWFSDHELVGFVHWAKNRAS